MFFSLWHWTWSSEFLLLKYPQKSIAFPVAAAVNWLAFSLNSVCEDTKYCLHRHCRLFPKTLNIVCEHAKYCFQRHWILFVSMLNIVFKDSEYCFQRHWILFVNTLPTVCGQESWRRPLSVWRVGANVTANPQLQRCGGQLIFFTVHGVVDPESSHFCVVCIYFLYVWF